MAGKTPFFKEFGPLLFGRPPRGRIPVSVRLDSLQELYGLFGHLVPSAALALQEKGVNSRTRLFPPQVTFWAFAAQILNPGSSCREAVERVTAWWRASAAEDAVTPSASSSAYCQARARLDVETLELIRHQVAWSLERQVRAAEQGLRGRSVKVVDGTGLSMPDTPANQARWPQPSAQKPGCGFPVLKLVGLFSLGSGALLESATAPLHTYEGTLLRQLWSKLQPGDVVLADRGFCSYALVAGLQQERQVDSVMRLSGSRSADFRQGQRLGPNERLVQWAKPQTSEACPREEFAALPATLPLRLIRCQITTPGSRTKNLTLVTTLLDREAYPAEEICALYARRWQVELHFQQIKTYLGMNVLRCESPEMIEREVLMHQIAYNLVRSLLQRSAQEHDVPLGRLSFKGALDTLRQWSPLIAAAGRTPRKQARLIAEMLARIAGDPVPLRPGRNEPRARKRRPKNYQQLSQPRAQMRPTPHRGQQMVKPAKVPLT